MTKRLFRIGLAALAVSALPGSSPARAQDEANADDDSDPCADAESPCGAAPEDMGDGAEPGQPGEGSEAGGEAAAAGDTGDAGPAMGPTLKEGAIALTASLQVGFSSDEVGGEAGNPLSIAPDVWYGINDSLSAGVVTSIHGMTGFWGGARSGLAGTGLCLSGEPDLADGVAAGCNGTFDNVGAEARYGLKADASFGFALDAGLHAVSLDPGEEIDPLLDVKLGARGTWRSGRISIGFAPSVFLALTERGEPPDGADNHDLLFVPIDLGFMLTPHLGLGVQSGVATSFQHMSEDYVVPVALGAIVAINEKMMLAASFSLDRVTGGTRDGVEEDTQSGAKLRSFSLVFGYVM